MMNHYNYSNRGDLQYDRLFFLFYQYTGQFIEHYKIIKQHVLLVETENNKYILKRYPTKNALLLQILLSKYLSGKNIIIPYRVFPNDHLFIEENGFWGIMPYINGTSLSFKNVNDQQRGLEQIHCFHKEIFGMYFSVQAPQFSLYSYWKKRYQIFREGIYSISTPTYLKQMVSELLRWGEFVLKKLPFQYLQTLEKKARFENQWIHGDVASHNFLRTKEDTVLLLDCDLVSSSPNEYDYLQYSHRLMPHYNWEIASLEGLKNEYLCSLLEKPWFVLAFVYPADLYREWNRYFRGQKRDIQLLIHYTEEHFSMRISTVNQIMKTYKNIEKVYD